MQTASTNICQRIGHSHYKMAAPWLAVAARAQDSFVFQCRTSTPLRTLISFRVSASMSYMITSSCWIYDHPVFSASWTRQHRSVYVASGCYGSKTRQSKDQRILLVAQAHRGEGKSSVTRDRSTDHTDLESTSKRKLRDCCAVILEETLLHSYIPDNVVSIAGASCATG